jgi:L-lysine 6-transaminase
MQKSKPLSRSEVARIGPNDVHTVLGRTMLVDGFDFVYDLDKSHGLYLHDSRTGKEFLDFFSFFASWPVSHNHPKMNDPAFVSELSKVALHNPANSDAYTVEMAKFVATFERVVMGEHFKHLFFVQTGSLAVENALKTAFDWKVQKNLAKGKGEKGKKVLHFKEAFHGRGGYTLSLTNTNDPRKWQYFPLWTDWPRITTPKASFPLDKPENLKATQAREQQALKEINDVLAREADDIACIILEPIQGEGGDNHFRPEFWQALRRIANENDILLISDEVQAGMGFTGKVWCFEHYGIVPDIISFGKKAQVCGILATSRLDEIKTNVFNVSSRINSTWGGNLVDMVRCRRFLEIIEEDNLVQNAAVVGAQLLEKLQALEKEFPSLVYNARGKGLMCAFDLVTPEICNEVRSRAYDKGLLLLSCGTQTIRFRSVLDTKPEHVIAAYSILRESVAEVAAKQNKTKAAL